MVAIQHEKVQKYYNKKNEVSDKVYLFKELYTYRLKYSCVQLK